MLTDCICKQMLVFKFQIGIKEKPKKIIGYCRVSSNKQKDDLKRQVENMQLYL